MLDPSEFESWRAELLQLVHDLRTQTTRALLAAGESVDVARRLARPVGPRGSDAGDLTFGLDAPGEALLDRWLLQAARERPLSLLTEDRGWRHRGPAPERPGESMELPDFDHGGPRIAIDPVDGTRNLMVGLRSAWSVISFAPAGAGMPKLSELSAGIVSELPSLRAALMSTFVADSEGCRLEQRELCSGRLLSQEPQRVDADDRVDHGYFPFFRFEPRMRPHLAWLEAEFCALLASEEGADPETIYDDQYISNAGQLTLLMQGTYRMIVDARALAAEYLDSPTPSSRPYDLAGAIFCARAAGAEVRAADGGELDFPIDNQTPVHMAAYVNRATRLRLEPHLLKAQASWARWLLAPNPGSLSAGR